MQQIGVDIFKVSRMEDALTYGQDYLDTVFTCEEQSIARKHQQVAYYYGSLFALKEATFKALQISWQAGMSWLDFEIISYPETFPRICLQGKTLEIATSQKIHSFSASHSYDGDYIFASVLCQKE